jgi:hypothetical protein
MRDFIMERLNNLLGFAGVLIFVISLFLLGNHNQELPNYVKLLVPQKIQSGIATSLKTIDELPWFTYQVITESGSILTEGSNELTYILQAKSDATYDLFSVFIYNLNINGSYLAEGTIDSINTIFNLKNEISEIMLSQAGDMGNEVFFETPKSIEIAFLSPIEEKISYAFIETRDYTENEIAKPISYDLLDINTTLASE